MFCPGTVATATEMGTHELCRDPSEETIFLLLTTVKKTQVWLNVGCINPKANNS